MLYAVFEDGSRQYMVEEGDLVTVDSRDAKVGEKLEFDRVLAFQTGEDLKVGQPTVDGAKVVGEVVDHPSEKTYIQKFRRRKTYRRFKGHRQHFSRFRILELILPGWERPEPEPEEDVLEQEELDQEEDELEDEEYEDEDEEEYEDEDEEDEEDEEDDKEIAEGEKK